MVMSALKETMEKETRPKKEENVYLFIPNIIGYFRIAFGIAAFWYYQNCGLFWIFYFLSYFLDCIDGFAARYFGQATRFGQMLDMVTDRCCSACLFALLVSVYDGPASFAFQMLIALDLASHYCHVYSQLLSGTSSHKKMDADENWILKIYYGSQKVLFVCCLLNESFFVMLYVLSFTNQQSPFAAALRPYFEPLCMAFAPVMAIKQLCNLLQLASACRKIVAYDVAFRSGKAT